MYIDWNMFYVETAFFLGFKKSVHSISILLLKFLKDSFLTLALLTFGARYIFVVGTVLCIIECSAASPGSTRWTALPHPPSVVTAKMSPNFAKYALHSIILS